MVLDKIIVIYVVFTVLISFVWAEKKYGGGPNSFYQISFTPRETAMGGAGVTSAKGVFSPYWNPAGLVNSDSTKYSFGVVTRTNWGRSGIGKKFGLNMNHFDYNIIGLHYKPNFFNWIFAVNLLNFNVKDIKQTELNINNEIEILGNFNSSESIFIISASKQYPGFDIGLNLKITHKEYSSILYKNTSFAGADFGFVYPLMEYLPFELRDFLRYANLGTVLLFDNDSKNKQKRIILGTSFKTYELYDWSLLVSFESQAGDFMPNKAATGVEFDYKNLLFFRAGLNRNGIYPIGNNVNSYSIGGGVIIQNNIVNINIDISYIYYRGNFGEYLSLIDAPLKLGVIISFK